MGNLQIWTQKNSIVFLQLLPNNIEQHSKSGQATLLLDWGVQDIPPDPGVGPGRGNKSLT